MEISIMSDLHFDVHRANRAEVDARNEIYEFLNGVYDGADVLVMPGDLINVRSEEEFRYNIEPFCLCFPHVVFVPGNHEHWFSDCGEVKARLKAAEKYFPNLYVLYNESCIINGQKFIGGTGWYDMSNEYIAKLWKKFPDSWCIKGVSEKWVQEQHDEFMALLDKELNEGDIVVTHHAPHTRSIISRYIAHWANPFYTNQMPNWVWERKPRLWAHGHLHSQIYYCVDKTEVICNPRGHAHDEPVGFKPDLRIFV